MGYPQLSAVLAAPAVVAGSLKAANGQTVLTSAATTVVTGMATAVLVVANLDSDPVLTCARATGSVGDQAGNPAAGSIILKAWMSAGVLDTTPVAATGFAGKRVNWIAFGT